MLKLGKKVFAQKSKKRIILSAETANGIFVAPISFDVLVIY